MASMNRQQVYIDNVLSKYFENVERATEFDRLHWIREGSHGQDFRIAYWKDGVEYALPWRGLSVWGPGYGGNGGFIPDAKWEGVYQYRGEYYAMYWGRNAPIMYKVSGLRDGYRIDNKRVAEVVPA